MAQFFTVHPDNPQPRLIRQAVALLQTEGTVVAYPTDSCYALGCRIGDKEAVRRIREIRGVGEDHLLTLVCQDLGEIARYAKVDNQQYRLLKAGTPGCYTFILEATREVPRRLQHPKRATVGLRVPANTVLRSLLAELGEPLLSSSLILPGEELPLTDPYEIREHLERNVDLIIDAGVCGVDLTTVIDLTGSAPSLLRAGKGDVTPFGLEN